MRCVAFSTFLGLMLLALPSPAQSQPPTGQFPPVEAPPPPSSAQPPPPPAQPAAPPPAQPTPSAPWQQWQQQQPAQWQQPRAHWQRQPPIAQPPKPREESSFASSLGLKLLAGGNLWTAPDNIEPGWDALGFAGSGGGFGWGIALYYEARIAEYFGLELDAGYDHSTLQRDLTYKINGVPFRVNEKVSASGVRLGLLLKAIAPVTFGRVWFGIGPEYVSGSSVDGKVEVVEGQPDDALRAELESSIRVKQKSSAMLTLAFGIAIEIGDNWEIPLDLRAARNLSQASDWNERVDIRELFADPPRYEVTVQSSWDFRLATGLGYRF